MRRQPSGGDPIGLASRAARYLVGGGRHTLDLAREVLRLSGNPSAASAAVFSLLGGDPRFQVDSQGRWSLSGWAAQSQGSAAGSDLDAPVFAVVDVETTGGSPQGGHRITEVAVVTVAGDLFLDEFRTLVNPGRPIPPRIQELTGITADMVADAPFFEDVAEAVAERLEGRVFVAHNASFDWNFLSYQLSDALGEPPRSPRLCTLRLARRLLPQLRRPNLDALAEHFRVAIQGRHRALGDAQVTAKILLRLLEVARDRGFMDLSVLMTSSEREVR